MFVKNQNFHLNRLFGIDKANLPKTVGAEFPRLEMGEDIYQFKIMEYPIIA